MSENTDYQPVVFENSQGEEVSNDPVWLAKKTLEKYGAQQGVAFGSTRPQRAADYDEVLIDTSKYDGLKGPELVALAKERGVDITGLKKVGEVREALATADLAGEQGADGGSADDNQE